MIAVGVDTHKERHHAVALDHLGQILAELVFMASAAGYRELQDWAEALAATESWCSRSRVPAAGAPACATCDTPDTRCSDERPRRRDRRAGKSDRIDAIASEAAQGHRRWPRARRRFVVLVLTGLRESVPTTFDVRLVGTITRRTFTPLLALRPATPPLA